MPSTFRSRGEKWKIVSAPVSWRMRCATAIEDILRRAIGLSVTFTASTPSVLSVRAPSSATEASKPFGGSTSTVTTRAAGSASFRLKADVSSGAASGRGRSDETKTDGAACAARRALPTVSRAIAATCSGPVPQQPPRYAAPACTASFAVSRK